jgi:ribosome-associated translation inhibitor RaiA/cold shock CspA family protein
MKLPLQITFRHMEPSPALEERIRKLMSRLDKFSAHIMHCHVVVEEPHQHGRQGSLFEFRIEITVPDEMIVITRAHDLNHAHEDAFVSLRDAFRTARRKLEDYERRHRQGIKAHVEPLQGRICEIDPRRSFGRIETADGRLFYFHRDSLVGDRLEDLVTGLRVRFSEQAGDLGPQASGVHVLGPQ